MHVFQHLIRALDYTVVRGRVLLLDLILSIVLSHGDDARAQ